MFTKKSIFDKFIEIQWEWNANTAGFHDEMAKYAGYMSDKEFDRLERLNYDIERQLAMTLLTENLQREYNLKKKEKD